MKSPKFIYFILAVFLALASCKDSSQELTTAIPSDAMYVVNIDTKSLIEKSQYDIFKNETVLKGLGIAKAFLSNQDAIATLDAITKDINAFGVNLKNDCYIYTNGYTYGVIFGVNDSEEIKKTIVNFSIEEDENIQSKDGVYSIEPQRNMCISWDKNKLIILTKLQNPTADKELDLIQLAHDQIKQRKEKSINAKPSFAHFLKDKKDISFLYIYENIINVGATFDDVSAVINLKELDFSDFKGVATAGFVSFEKGAIKMDSKQYYDTPEAEKKYTEQAKNISGILKGDQLKYITENPVFLASTNIKGNGLYEYLKKFNIITILEENLRQDQVDLKTLFGYIDGDFTFCLNGIKIIERIPSSEHFEYEDNTKVPNFTLMLDVKNGSEVLTFIKTTMDGLLYQISPDIYTFEASGVKGYLGVKNNLLYCTNNETVFKNISSGNESKNLYADIIKGKTAFISGDFKSLEQIALENSGDDSGLIKEGFNLIGPYQFTSSDNMTGQGALEIAYKDKNSLAAICAYVDKVLNSLASKSLF